MREKFKREEGPLLIPHPPGGKTCKIESHCGGRTREMQLLLLWCRLTVLLVRNVSRMHGGDNGQGSMKLACKTPRG